MLLDFFFGLLFFDGAIIVLLVILTATFLGGRFFFILVFGAARFLAAWLFIRIIGVVIAGGDFRLDARLLLDGGSFLDLFEHGF